MTSMFSFLKSRQNILLFLIKKNPKCHLHWLARTKPQFGVIRKVHTKVLSAFPPSRVTSKLESAASTSSTSDSLVKSCISADDDNLLMWYCKETGFRNGISTINPLASSSFYWRQLPCNTKHLQRKWHFNLNHSEIQGWSCSDPALLHHWLSLYWGRDQNCKADALPQLYPCVYKEHLKF